MFVAAVLVRAAVEVAYWPATYFSDTWAYVEMAFGGAPIGVDPLKPSGYPLIIRVLTLPARELGTITVVQHLAGIATGLLAYALLLRLGIRRWVSAAVAALILLDAHAIALEQEVMPEAFFSLPVMACAYLSVGKRLDLRMLLAAGLLLAAAATIRTQAVFAIPVWLAYVAWRGVGWRNLTAAGAAVMVPLLVYGAIHARSTGNFGLTTSEGWALYGRVGRIARCGDADVPVQTRPLCDQIPADAPSGFNYFSYYVFEPESPAVRLFRSDLYEPEPSRRDQVNGLLRSFSVGIIRERPFDFTELVAGDFLRFFDPGASSPGDNDEAITLPGARRSGYINEEVRGAHLPDYEQRVSEPAGALLTFQRWFQTPRWLLGFVCGLALISGAAAVLSRGRLPLRHGRETFLLLGMSLAMMLGSVLTVQFILRHMIPVLPLLWCGGTLGLADLEALVRRLNGRGA